MARFYIAVISAILLAVNSSPVAGDDITVDGWSDVSDPDVPAIIVNGFQTVSASTDVFVDGTSYVTSAPNADMISTYTVTTTISGNPVVHLVTTTIYYPGVESEATETASSANISSHSTSTVNKGAIVGGIVGSIVVLFIAILLFLRIRNKRSVEHWRNRGDLSWNHDVKTVPSQNSLYDLPYDGSIQLPPRSNYVTPLTPGFIRSKDRLTASKHRRNQSSFGSFGSPYRDESIELGAPRDEVSQNTIQGIPPKRGSPSPTKF
ncbi:hypothetical protein C8J56DRAFT_422671 [Mycena floridula]|nr:hypothetical protein C8J56DRAFT_422671 [Mycena floridula]